MSAIRCTLCLLGLIAACGTGSDGIAQDERGHVPGHPPSPVPLDPSVIPRPSAPVPAGAVPVPARARRKSVIDDDPIGRRFVEPPALPDAPAGVDELINRPAAEQEAIGGLTLESLLAMACENNPTLVQARMQVSGTLGKALQAGLWPNPVFNYVGEQIGVKGTPGEFQGAIIQQEIVTADKREISRAKYLQRAEVAEFLAVAQQWRVCNDVRIHFWRAVGHRQIVDIRRELLESAEDLAVTARELWNLGQITRANLHMADVALQQARLELLRAENQYRQEFYELTALVGVDLAVQPLRGDIDEAGRNVIDFEAALAKLYAESPEVLAARAKWRADQITLRREIVEPIPNVIIRGGAGYNFEAKETTAVAGLVFEVPIWDKNQGTIQQAEADLARQAGEIRRTQLRLRQELAQRYQDYLTALQHVTEFETVILPAARTAYANQLDAYKEDRQQWTDVLDTQQEYFDLQRRFLEQLIVLRTNEILIEGFLLHDGLMAPPTPTPPGHIDAVPQPR